MRRRSRRAGRWRRRGRAVPAPGRATERARGRRRRGRRRRRSERRSARPPRSRPDTGRRCGSRRSGCPTRRGRRSARRRHNRGPDLRRPGRRAVAGTRRSTGRAAAPPRRRRSGRSGPRGRGWDRGGVDEVTGLADNPRCADQHHRHATRRPEGERRLRVGRVLGEPVLAGHARHERDGHVLEHHHAGVEVPVRRASWTARCRSPCRARSASRRPIPAAGPRWPARCRPVPPS